MSRWKCLAIFLSVLLMCSFFLGCESVTPRPDISVTKMERIFFAEQQEFNAVQKLIVTLLDGQSDRSIRIARPDTETTDKDGAAEEELILSTGLSMSEEERLALLKAVRPLFDRTPIQVIFANEREIYFYFYEEWGYEHYVAYRTDGRVPGGSFGNVQDSKEIASNWYAAIAHD